MFSENKLEQFSKKIIKLEDRPQMSAQALKEYFDSSAEELRVKFNALIDALSTFGAESLDAVDYNAAEYKLTFSFKNGRMQTIDLPLELLIESGHYDAASESIVLTLANGDVITIPVSDLIDTYAADEETLTKKDNTFSVKDGVFTKEAPADGTLYARKDGKWKAIIEGLPHVKLSEAAGITEGLYVVDDAFADWSVGTNEKPLTCALLIAGAELYGKDYENSYTHQMLVLPSGELWSRAGTGEWKSAIPSLDGYAKTEDVVSAIAKATPGNFELIASGETTEEVNSIIISRDNDGNPFELCDRITIYMSSPVGANTSAVTVNFGLDLIQQVSNGVLNTSASLSTLHAVHTGRRWEGFECSLAASGANAAVKSRMNGYAVANNNAVKEIRLYLYNSSYVLPVGFKYRIYGRRVKK